jgi:hypothetical protein
MYISFDDGKSWRSFQLELPMVPITDLAVKHDNLIVATQGRSFWIMDDLTPLHQLNATIAQSDFHLFKPMTSYRMGSSGGFGAPSKTEAPNHPGGVMIHYVVKDTAKAAITLEIMEMNGTLIKKFSSKPDKKLKEEKLESKPGMNRFVWNMRYADAEGFDGLIMWSGGLTGPRANLGTYKAKLTVNGKTSESEFEIVKDPRSAVTPADIKAQFDFLIQVRDKLSETNKAIVKIRKIRDQMNQVTGPLKDKEEMKPIVDMAKTTLDEMKKIEETLYQTKNRSRQDPLNFPVRLNDKLAGVGSEAESGDYRPTEQTKAVYKELSEKIDVALSALDKIVAEQVPKFNALVKEKQIAAVTVPD